MAARIARNSSFDTPINQLIEKLGWKTINDLTKESPLKDYCNVIGRNP